MEAPFVYPATNYHLGGIWHAFGCLHSVNECCASCDDEE